MPMIYKGVNMKKHFKYLWIIIALTLFIPSKGQAQFGQGGLLTKSAIIALLTDSLGAYQDTTALWADFIRLYSDSIARRPDISTDSLVFYAPLDELLGDVVIDYSGQNNHGTNSGGVIRTDPDSSFNGGGAWAGDGVASYINIDNVLTNSLATTVAGAFEVWVEPVNATESDQSIIAFGVEGSNADFILLRISSTTGFLYASAKDGGTVQWILETTVTAFPNNKGALVALVQDGTEPVLYINGIKPAQTFSNETDKTSWFLEQTALDVGRAGALRLNGVSLQLFRGGMDEIKIWKRAPTADEMLSSCLNSKHFSDRMKKLDSKGLVAMDSIAVGGIVRLADGGVIITETDSLATFYKDVTITGVLTVDDTITAAGSGTIILSTLGKPNQMHFTNAGIIGINKVPTANTELDIGASGSSVSTDLRILGGQGGSAFLSLTSDLADDNGDTWLIYADNSSNRLIFTNNLSGSAAILMTIATDSLVTTYGPIIINDTLAVLASESSGNIFTVGNNGGLVVQVDADSTVVLSDSLDVKGSANIGEKLRVGSDATLSTLFVTNKAFVEVFSTDSAATTIASAGTYYNFANTFSSNHASSVTVTTDTVTLNIASDDSVIMKIDFSLTGESGSAVNKGTWQLFKNGVSIGFSEGGKERTFFSANRAGDLGFSLLHGAINGDKFHFRMTDLNGGTWGITSMHAVYTEQNRYKK